MKYINLNLNVIKMYNKKNDTFVVFYSSVGSSFSQKYFKSTNNTVKRLFLPQLRTFGTVRNDICKNSRVGFLLVRELPESRSARLGGGRARRRAGRTWRNIDTVKFNGLIYDGHKSSVTSRTSPVGQHEHSQNPLRIRGPSLQPASHPLYSLSRFSSSGQMRDCRRASFLSAPRFFFFFTSSSSQPRPLIFPFSLFMGLLGREG